MHCLAGSKNSVKFIIVPLPLLDVTLTLARIITNPAEYVRLIAGS